MTPVSLLRALGIEGGHTVAVAGCGGKTSLLLHLAREGRELGWRVLLSTTTKIGRWEVERRDHLYTAPEQWRRPSPLPGIHLAGVPAGEKLAALPPEELEHLRRGFDLTLLECDGSRSLPLKGWRRDEPVIPSWADCTVGVAVTWPVGRPLDESIAFQPELFAHISDARFGEPVTTAHIAGAVAHPEGLFHGARGRRILYLNQVETPEDFKLASQVVDLLPENFWKALDLTAAGSTRLPSCIPIKRRALS